MSERTWTPEQDKLIRGSWGRVSLSEIARQMGLPVKPVQRRSKFLQERDSDPEFFGNPVALMGDAVLWHLQAHDDPEMKRGFKLALKTKNASWFAIWSGKPLHCFFLELRRISECHAKAPL